MTIMWPDGEPEEVRETCDEVLNGGAHKMADDKDTKSSDVQQDKKGWGSGGC